MITILILTNLLLTCAAILNWVTYKRFYNDKTLQIAGTAVELSDEEYLMRLYETVKSDEFKEVSEKAKEAGNLSLIAFWLEDKGLYEEFNYEIENLKMLC